MTTKRFVGRCAGRNIKKLIGIEDIETNRVCVTIEENIRLLNELNNENEQLRFDFKEMKGLLHSFEDENKELKDKNSRLQETLAFRSNQLALMEQLIDDLGSEEMARQMELILND